MPLQKPYAFQRGDRLYLVAPVVPHTPTEQEIEEYAFGKSVVDELRRGAPNPHIAWFGGHYVEGDRPNRNGAMWLTEDLLIASLTPMMMPVTVMHDPRTAVGCIAHAELLLADEEKQRPRSKIETALACWRHRFPEAVAEAEHNHGQGTLMQSMECLAPRYECSECRMAFVKLPKGAEEANWCDHLKASNPGAGYHSRSGASSAHEQNRNASRILRGVTFTGTGLIFGSRGAVGADPEANLESFQEEIAEFHDKAHHDSTYRSTPKKKSKSTASTRGARTMEIEDREYAELVAAKQERDGLKPRVENLEAEAAKVPDLTKKVESLEAEVASEKEKREAAEAKVKEAEETANAQKLRDERWEKFGSAFTAKLDTMPTTKANLLQDAATLDEEAWSKRLAEVKESTGVDPEADKEGKEKNGGSDKENAIFSREEVAKFGGGGNGGNGGGEPKEPTLAQRSATMGKLFAPPAKKS